MQKKIFAVFAAIFVVCFLASCHADPTENTTAHTQSAATPTESETHAITTETVPAGTDWYSTPDAFTTPDDFTSPDVEAIPPQTTSPTQQPEAFTSYLERVPWADQSIFDGPGYDFSFVGTVELAGTYTIVEEAWDDEGNLWGRLKSGAGWIDLSDNRSEVRRQMPISANFADDRLIHSSNFHHCVVDASEYAVQIAFRARESLTDVSLFSMLFTADDFEITEELYYITEMDPEKPLVADLSFPGDMSMYAIRVTDSDGVTYCYSVSISGRNGTLFFAEYTP